MDLEIKREVLARIEREYSFKPKRSADGAVWMRGGVCPTCGKKEMYTHQEHPWVLRCGRIAKCGAEIHVKELYSDLFENWGNRFKKTPEAPNAAADAYLRTARGFDIEKIAGWYSQENYFDHEKKIDALALIVPLDAEQIDYVQGEIICMTVERQMAINADHPLVQEFWDIFDYIEGDDPDMPVLNHSRNETEIAINLNHLVQVATDRRQQLPDINVLKKLLRTSRFRKFIDVKPVNSAIHAIYNTQRSVNVPAKPSTVKCWVFKRN
ncbi:hypothetical protein [Propionivibrio limicola]|uniref:hypothetical protein n=1 Tax=Propionivibrio limicola TaxID=167645 RepID=UPI001292A991|nr:hypothetical protein [Propionivibrio limicola]